MTTKISVKQHLAESVHAPLAACFEKMSGIFSKRADSTGDPSTAQDCEKLAACCKAQSDHHAQCAADLCGDDSKDDSKKAAAAAGVPAEFAHLLKTDEDGEVVSAGAQIPPEFQHVFGSTGE